MIKTIENRRVPILSAEQEVELAKRIEIGVFAAEQLANLENPDFVSMTDATTEELQVLASEGEAAKEQFIEANFGLVKKVANDHSRSSNYLGFDDLFQEGAFGLMHAIEMFDYTRGGKFSSYAVYWIKQHIARAKKEGSLIHIPNNVRDAYSQIAHEERALNLRLGRPPTDQELFDAVASSDNKITYGGKTVARSVAEMTQFLQNIDMQLTVASLNSPVGEDSGTETGDLLPDSSEEPDEVAVDNTYKKQLWQRIGERLTERQMAILRARFIGEKSLSGIGDDIGLTAERVRQIQNSIMARLEHPSSGLSPDLLEFFD